MQKCRSDRTNEKNLGCGDALASHYVAETSGEFSEVGHGQQRPHSLAEDAVRRQPVSADRFPANREINREFCEIRPLPCNFGVQSSNEVNRLEPNSLRNRTGNFLVETGKPGTQTGNLGPLLHRSYYSTRARLGE